jgi:hypothetical protein
VVSLKVSRLPEYTGLSRLAGAAPTPHPHIRNVL